jgi:hypothetical protein
MPQKRSLNAAQKKYFLYYWYEISAVKLPADGHLFRLIMSCQNYLECKKETHYNFKISLLF